MHDFQSFYERYARTLYRFALGLTGNAAEAEDLVADAFVRLWAAPAEIRDATVKAYLFAIVRNLFLSRRARAARHVPLDDREPDRAPPLDERTGSARELGALRQHLAALAGAVRVRVHRARIHLARAIGRTMKKGPS